MPLFLSEEEFSRCSHDAALVAEKADGFIRGLLNELETVKARADASDITAEQNCSLIEQKYRSLTTEFTKLESNHAQLQSTLDQRLSELSQVQANEHRLHLQSVEKDGELERLRMEASELHKSKRQLIELIEQKDLELSERSAAIKSYLDKIVHLSEIAAQKEARMSEIEAELARTQASCTRLLQERELIEKHNVWLNDELDAKVNSLIELRRNHSDLEAEMSSKLADVEKQYNECSKSLQWNKDRVKELQEKVASIHEELCSSKEAAVANEEQLSAELSTVSRLSELYKQSSQEWSRKAGELEGVIRAIESHLKQVESDYKEKLEKEVSEKRQLEREAADLKVKLEKCEAEVESSKKANELNLLPLSSYTTNMWVESSETNDVIEESGMVVPKIPVGVSGTALAASLLRDGWSLVKMYTKYQEAVDALRHEQLGRKEAEAILQRVLYEIEEKAEAILDERAEHERMVDAYSAINQKLQNSLSEKMNLEKIIQELKADNKRCEYDYTLAQKEIGDLQKQVTILLKECRNIQLRCGSARFDGTDDTAFSNVMNTTNDAEQVISEHLLTFKDINGLVEQNVQLRSLVRSLTEQTESRELEFKEKLDLELKKCTDEAASKVEAVLQRAEEQGHMIESLHASVAMYKKLYEEEHNLRSSHPRFSEATPEGRTNFMPLIESSQEATKAAQEQALERVRRLEEDLSKSRNEIISLRSERERLAMEANFAKEKLDSFMKQFEHQKAEANGILARNVEFSQLIVEYQRKLRESSESLRAADELSRKLTVELSVLKHENEMISSAEKRACEEVRSLSERVHRLQASLDTLRSTEEVREEVRVAERRKQEEYLKKLERDWAEAKKELLEERENLRTLRLDREQTMKSMMKQIEEMGKELANALHAVAAAESRAAVAEAKLSDIQSKIRSSDNKVAEVDDGSAPHSLSSNEVVVELCTAKEEIQRLREEAQANKAHMLQYKSIAQVNEDALKQMELVNEKLKNEADILKKSMEDELLSLRERVKELETESSLKSKEIASAAAVKEEALASSKAEITNLKEELSTKASSILNMEVQVASLKEDLKNEHERWRVAQNNYERQVILQSETIQELTKTSSSLALLQEEASMLRKSEDSLRSENNELKAKWEVEKAVLEQSKIEAEKKCNEIDEQNKILHARLEAFHIQRAEKERGSTGLSSDSTSADAFGDAGLQNVISYLRRQKEIAETEFSLLKQEKIRLQSQLDSAMKAADAARVSLEAEREKSRSLLFSEEEIKSLQLQVREMNLLRESNMQLREENKHNYEECQKLRKFAEKSHTEAQNLENQLRKREVELEVFKREIVAQKMEKENLENRVSELLERYKNFDVEDYNRLKDNVQTFQDKIKEKDAQIDEISKSLSEKQERISQLEQELSKCRSEITDKERRINDIQIVEATLKSDLERQRKASASWKKRVDILTKEKDEQIKEKEALSRQLEEFKQGKRSVGDSSGEQAMKEEKDTKIQILEKHLERQREELKKEKEDNRMERARRLKSEKAVKDSYNNIEQEKTKFISELERHKQALKRLSDELEKLKAAKGNLSEGTNVIQHLSGPSLDDLASAYVSAVNDFEKEALSVISELGGRGVCIETTTVADAPLTSASGSAVHVSSANVASTVIPLASSMPAKAADVSEKRPSLQKASVLTRKSGRRLVRPCLVKPEEPQGDRDMSESEGPQNEGKSEPPTDTDSQGALPVHQLIRKRAASPSGAELREESVIQGDNVSDLGAPLLKKSKGSELSQENTEGQPASPLEVSGTQPAGERLLNTGELHEGSNEGDEVEKDDTDNAAMKDEDSKEPQHSDGAGQVETDNDKTNIAEDVDKAGGMNLSEDGQRDQAETDSLQPLPESLIEREEGELVSEAHDLEGGSDFMDTQEAVQGQPGATPELSPGRAEDEGLEAGEINSPELQTEDRIDEADMIEDAVDGSDKSNEGNEPITAGNEQNVEPASFVSETTMTPATETGSSKPSPILKQGTSSSTSEADEVRQPSPMKSPSTTINLSERARARAQLRQAGVAGAPSSVIRGRGRAVPRGRAGRAIRGRRQPPSES